MYIYTTSCYINMVCGEICIASRFRWETINFKNMTTTSHDDKFTMFQTNSRMSSFPKQSNHLSGKFASLYTLRIPNVTCVSENHTTCSQFEPNNLPKLKIFKCRRILYRAQFIIRTKKSTFSFDDNTSAILINEPF